MHITDLIKAAKFEYEISTGLQATRVYLGRTEMLELMNFMSENLRPAPKDKNIEYRLFGLTAYAVDDYEPHIRCCN